MNLAEDLFPSFTSNATQIWANWFRIRLILETKFGEDLLSMFCQFKQR